MGPRATSKELFQVVVANKNDITENEKYAIFFKSDFLSCRRRPAVIQPLSVCDSEGRNPSSFIARFSEYYLS